MRASGRRKPKGFRRPVAASFGDVEAAACVFRRPAAACCGDVDPAAACSGDVDPAAASSIVDHDSLLVAFAKRGFEHRRSESSSYDTPEPEIVP